MQEPEEKRLTEAAAAREEQISPLVYDPSPRVMRALVGNRHLREEDVLIIAGRKNLPGDILDAIFKDKRWAESYPVRLALAKNPKTPLFTALSIARYLRLFDLAELTRSHFLPVIYRRKLEALLTEKIPTMALGVKKSLAKIASGEVLMKLIQDGYPEVVKLCLDNPYLVEAYLYKVINRRNTTPGAIRTIAGHTNWSSRYPIKFALVRNEHTPLARSALFLHDLRTNDLKELYRDPTLSTGTKPLIHRELRERGEEPKEREEETVYEIDEDDECVVEEFTKPFEGNDGEKEQRGVDGD